jgi:hypothetical protein
VPQPTQPTPAPEPGAGPPPPPQDGQSTGGKVKAAVTGALPDLTVPQILAFAVFLIVVLISGVEKVHDAEFDQVRKLAVFVIGALLPSDAVIRFGRSLFLKAAQAATADDAGTGTAETFRATTLAQFLAFLTFVTVAILALTGNTLATPNGKDVVQVAVFLVAALLPSEAAIRFGRALYLRNVPQPTTSQLKKI